MSDEITCVRYTKDGQTHEAVVALSDGVVTTRYAADGEPSALSQSMAIKKKELPALYTRRCDQILASIGAEEIEPPAHLMDGLLPAPADPALRSKTPPAIDAAASFRADLAQTGAWAGPDVRSGLVEVARQSGSLSCEEHTGPISDGERIYVSDYGVSCYDAETLRALWSISFTEQERKRPGAWKNAFRPMMQWSQPVVAAGMVLASSNKGLLALDGATGAVRWRSSAAKNTLTPLVHNGRVYAGARFKPTLHCLHLGTGRKLFSLTLKQNIAGLATDGERLFVNTLGLECYPLDGGQPLWVAERAIGRLPVVGDGRVYTTIYGTPAALDAATGEVIWKREADEDAEDQKPENYRAGYELTLADGAVLYMSNQGWLTARDAATGDLRWRRHFVGKPFAESPYTAVFGETVVTLWRNQIWGTSLVGGAPLWRIDVPEHGAGAWQGIRPAGGDRLMIVHQGLVLFAPS